MIGLALQESTLQSILPTQCPCGHVGQDGYLLQLGCNTCSKWERGRGIRMIRSCPSVSYLVAAFLHPVSGLFGCQSTYVKVFWSAMVSNGLVKSTAPRRKDAADITGGVGGNSDAACCAKSCALFSCVGKSLVGKCWEMLGMLGIMTWKLIVFNPSMPFYAHVKNVLSWPRLSRLSRLSHVQLPPARFTLVDTWPANHARSWK